jgi:uncharacterized membrane protein
MERDDIHILARHSDLPPQHIDQLLKENIYPKPVDWLRFGKWTFLALGIGLSLSGVVFFFAYNWQYLPKFVKMGVIAMAIVSLVMLYLFAKWESTVKKTLLTAACVLTGVLFAVYGQIYQTGANAFDFFLAWTLFSVVWVAIARFPVLWCVFIVLLNTTFFFYIQQLAPATVGKELFPLWALLNFLLFLYVHLRPRLISGQEVAPKWLTYLLVAATVAFASLGFEVSIRESDDWVRLSVCILLTLTVGATFYRLGHHSRSIFLIVSVCILVLFVGISTMTRYMRGPEAIRLAATSLFLLLALFFMVRYLLKLNQNWKNETR